LFTLCKKPLYNLICKRFQLKVLHSTFENFCQISVIKLDLLVIFLTFKTCDIMQKKDQILWKPSSISIQKTYLSLHTAIFKLKTAWSIPQKGSIQVLIFT